MSKEWKYSYTEMSKADPQAIWQRWTMVERWPEEDKNLEWAKLENDFIVGHKIIMKPKGSPKSKVTIIETTPNKSFATEGNIPFGKLIISHSLKVQPDQTTSFTHTITLTGPLRNVFVKLFAGKLANDLPEKMKNISQLAETL